MRDYLCYLLDGAGAIRSVEALTCPDDDEACDEARRRLAQRPQYRGFELWLRDRRVHVEVIELA